MFELLQKLVDVFVPEEARLRKLLSLEPSAIYRLLPKSNLNQRGVIAIFDYQNKMVRLLVKAVKFKNNPTARKLVAGFLHDEYLSLASDALIFEGSSPILVPVPMSKKEKRSRGYNQSEELAKEIQMISGNKIEVGFGLLQKVRDTKRQVYLSRVERLKNLKNCMRVYDPDKTLRNKVVILLDDIHTTGSTFEEAERALEASGVRKVLGLFVAH